MVYETVFFNRNDAILQIELVVLKIIFYQKIADILSNYSCHAIWSF